PDSRDAEESAQDTSVELFLQRARRAHVGFTATPEDYPAIVRICQLVDGNPLGIELATAWVRTLSCDEIAREIERGLDFLSVSTRDLPTRHRSMRAVFDHSWRLLTQEEQEVLLRLSVFRGGFRREAAEYVAAATLAVLSALVTKSFIRRSGDGRYDLHELIRQFAAQQFSERLQEQAATQARHSRYYLTYFGQAHGRLQSSAQRETLAELTTEIDNFRSAWEWALTHGEFALIEQTMRTFWMLYDTRGWLQEGLEMLGRTVSALETAHGQSPPDQTHQVALAHILTAQAVLATRLGQQEQAQATLERSLDILRPLDEPRVLVETITFLGLVMEFSGNYPRASEFYTEGLEVATAVGDRWFAALCRLLLAGEGSLRLPTSTPENAHERLQSVVADWRRIGDPRLTAIALNTLSWMAVRLGRYDEAREALEESVVLNTSIGDRWGLGFAYRGLGLIAQAQGEHLQALDMFRKSLDTLTELGARQDEARVLVEMSRSLFAQGNDADAERGWCEALIVTMETQGTFVALDALVGIATLKAKQGNIERALELLLVVLNHPASLQETKNRAAQLRGQLEAQLTSQQVAAAQTRAKATTFEAAVEAILQHAPAGRHHMAD
ncbi:MAG TPA: tetratricopeptide repeat protein, partial [Roseiflexaceae bacterium]|nr:tetratricopeptide repeat protein [Roseiflexaceae bacterium]